MGSNASLKSACRLRASLWILGPFVALAGSSLLGCGVEAGPSETNEVADPLLENLPTQTNGCLDGHAQNETNSAYATEFTQQIADDWVYIAWMWRTGSNAALNHSVSLMRSRDLKTWYNMCGERLTLPITPASRTVVDRIPPNAGLLNSRFALSFDSARRPIVSYHKYVNKTFSDGSVRPTTQVFNARWETNRFVIYQMTDWDSQDVIQGGGSLPGTRTSVGLQGLTITNDGRVTQAVTRSQADNEKCRAIEAQGGVCSSQPPSGRWLVDDVGGTLRFRWPLVSVPASSFESLDPYLATTPAPSSFLVTESTPFTAPGAAAWGVSWMRSRAETRWISLRADWNGDGRNDRGLFDRSNSRFVLDEGGQARSFQFGWRDGYFWPLVGDWDGDGRRTIGLYQPLTQRSYLKNSLTGGAADTAVTGDPRRISGLYDGPIVWHASSPSGLFALKWDTMPVNNDCGYTCDGISLSTGVGCLDRSRVCTDNTRFGTNLYLLEFNPASRLWSRSLVGRAWGGTRVGFDFVTFKNVQLVAYYGEDRSMRVAQRVRQAGVWKPWAITSLPNTFQGWDSHNYVTLMVDGNHNVHVAGNMHVHPLVYFRGTGYFGAEQPLTYTRQAMTGLLESRVTYPKFFRGPAGELLFAYRDGSSGAGDTYINRYDEGTGQWSRFVPSALFRGR